MDIIQEVRKFVEDECKKPTSKYGYEPFPYHFVPMVEYAQMLANQLNADKEIVKLAAWLHDIGSIIHGRKDYHITGAKIAEEKLREFGYPENKIKRVKDCILHHRGSQKHSRENVEEQIIVEADAMSAFDSISGQFKAAFTYENKTQGEAKKSVRKKLENKWNQLHLESSKRIILPKYEAAMLLLS
ncbi:metal-dependent phosphohydrolase [Candidatus Woesearchaeota archaeon CG10_big_fil_rev_8_21_14_0_10_36_11]|nr:MAG: metal-dependent phosphohydrolase [Candidatus Woesearchaeota archaeon CG10_big_fil_rev_8_21_14_0_10_36_11]